MRRTERLIWCKEDYERSLQALCAEKNISKYYSYQMKSTFVVFIVWVFALNICVFDVYVFYIWAFMIVLHLYWYNIVEMTLML